MCETACCLQSWFGCLLVAFLGHLICGRLEWLLLAMMNRVWCYWVSAELHHPFLHLRVGVVVSYFWFRRQITMSGAVSDALNSPLYEEGVCGLKTGEAAIGVFPTKISWIAWQSDSTRLRICSLKASQVFLLLCCFSSSEIWLWNDLISSASDSSDGWRSRHYRTFVYEFVDCMFLSFWLFLCFGETFMQIMETWIYRFKQELCF